MGRWWIPTIGVVLLPAILAPLIGLPDFRVPVPWGGPPRLVVPLPPPPGGSLSRPAGSGPDNDYVWWVTAQLSAYGALVVDVETDRPDQAVAIARNLIDPVSSSYVEVLLYVYPASPTATRAMRRVQWTRGAGYVELRLDQP